MLAVFQEWQIRCWPSADSFIQFSLDYAVVLGENGRAADWLLEKAPPGFIKRGAKYHLPGGDQNQKGDPDTPHVTLNGERSAFRVLPKQDQAGDGD
jgi:hypothetical protein